MIAICITTFGAGIKNGTLTPYIVDDFGLPVEAGTWMAIMSGIGAVAFNPIFGRLADIYQRKTIAVIGVAISAVGYLLNVISPTYEIALVGWILMSFVMGAMLPAAPAYVASHYTGKQATRAMGIYPALSVLGFALGPLLAGWFVDLSGWRFACGMGAAITLVGAVMIFLMFPWAKKEELSQDRRIDQLGILAILFTVSAIMTLANRVQTTGVQSMETWGLIIAAIIGIALVIVVEKRVSMPLLDLCFIAQRSFIVPVILMMMVFTSLGATIYQTSFFTAAVTYGSGFMVGLCIPAINLPMIIVSIFAGIIATRFGERNTAIVGVAVSAVGFFLMSRVTMTTQFWEIIAFSAVQGIGLGLFYPNLIRIALGWVPPQRIQSATSSWTMFVDTDGPIGVAVFGSMFGVAQAATMVQNAASRAAELGASAQTVNILSTQGLAGLANPTVAGELMTKGIDLTQFGTWAYAQGVVSGMNQTSMVQCVVAVVALVIAIFLLKNPVSTKDAAAKMAEYQLEAEGFADAGPMEA